MTAPKYLVSAGCSTEGTILNGQAYSGPLDAQSLADFVYSTLQDSIYSNSDTAAGMHDYDWTLADTASSQDEIQHLYSDYGDNCEAEPACDNGDCSCEPTDYWVSAVPA